MHTGQDYQSIPTCHVVMKVSDWRERYRLTDLSGAYATYRTLEEWLLPKIKGLAPSRAGWIAWMSDQRLLTEKLCTAPWFPQDAAMIERSGHPPIDRLDRAGWPVGNIDYSRFVDAHLPRVPDGPDSWPKLRALIERFIPHHLAWADDYRREYQASYVD